MFDYFYVYPTSTPLMPVMINFTSEVESLVNSTVDICATPPTASMVSVDVSQLWFDPPFVVFTADDVTPVLVRVTGVADYIAEGSAFSNFSLTVCRRCHGGNG